MTRSSSGESLAFRTFRIQAELARILSAARTLNDALLPALEHICVSLSWDIGAIWGVEASSSRLHALASWKSPGIEDGARFMLLTRELRFGKNEGLPGRVWASGEPLILPDVTVDGNFARFEAAREASIHGGVCIPLLVKGEVAGVIEFFCRHQLPATHVEAGLLEALGSLSHQVSQYIELSSERDTLARANHLCAERVKALEASQEELKQRLLTREGLMGVVTHELKNPLTAIQLNATVLNDFAKRRSQSGVGSSRVDLQACKLEYSIVSPK